jgi:hypothetical protein
VCSHPSHALPVGQVLTLNIMNAFDDNNVKPKTRYTGLAHPPRLLLFWGFDVQLLAQTYGGYYEGGVFKALLTGVKELSESKNKRKRERDFTMWG